MKFPQLNVLTCKVELRNVYEPDTELFFGITKDTHINTNKNIQYQGESSICFYK